ncbi:MAG: hypothetical protein KJ893_00865 [Candidatus Omnitrophica bacterium]|nr:hypothetical protein [Candidatus Omnitrophota bacterium]MBU4478162.1 hypothetical protein [Candidatus Omnitrophota bacterium]MCG2703083.1 hypothetical protein [Candidatus Omnitrophota bacterium]
MKKIIPASITILPLLVLCAFTPLEKATDEVGGGKNIDADAPSAESVRERSSLTGFTSGIELERSEKHDAEPGGPVLKYEETVYPQKSPKEKYEQYHLLAVTSLEEAKNSLAKNSLWAYRMAHNAGNYIRLLQKLIKEEYRQEIAGVNERLIPLVRQIKKGDLPLVKTKDIENELEHIAKLLENKYSYDKVALWITQ